MALPLQHDIHEGAHEKGDIYRWMSNATDIINEMIADHATMKAAVDNIKSALQGNYVIGVAALTLGSQKDDVANALFHYMIGGKHYIKAAITAGTAPGNDVIPEGLFGAVAFDIGADGTVDAIEAPANATGYASAALAVAALPAAATAHARMGWVTATSADGAFTFGTTEFDAADTTVAFTDAPTLANAITAAAPATLTNITPLTLTKG